MISTKLTKKKKAIIVISAVLLVALVLGCIQLFGYYLPKRREEAELQRQIRRYYDAKILSYAEENEKYGDYEVDVAFLGDSLTDGYDVKNYYPHLTVANRGIGGETTFGLEKRLGVSLYDLKPKVAVILIGANNMDSMLDNYERMIADIRETLPETEVIICSLTSMGGEDWGAKNELAAYNNVTLKLISKKYGCRFADLFSALFNMDTGEIYKDYTTDGGHLTPLGYEVVTRELTPIISDALSSR